MAARYERRTVIVSARLTEDESLKVKSLCEFFNKTPSGVIRTAINHFWYENEDLINGKTKDR